MPCRLLSKGVQEARKTGRRVHVRNLLTWCERTCRGPTGCQRCPQKMYFVRKIGELHASSHSGISLLDITSILCYAWLCESVWGVCFRAFLHTSLFCFSEEKRWWTQSTSSDNLSGSSLSIAKNRSSNFSNWAYVMKGFTWKLLTILYGRVTHISQFCHPL